jgi:hypothetical protein
MGMAQYDATLKLLLRGSARVALREITGTAIRTWHDVELPDARSLRLDVLGEAKDAGGLRQAGVRGGLHVD